MMMTIRALSTVAVLATGALTGTAGAQQVERYSLRGNDAALYNLVGEVAAIHQGVGRVSVSNVAGCR